MGFFRQVKKWVSQIYLIEENDPVHGGENGITNRPIRELADRTEYLKAHLTPKSLGANSQNQSDNDGHEHELPKASTTKKGIVQLTSDTGLDSETLGLSAKAGKVLAQGIASLRLALNGYIPNSKKSDSVTSSSSDTVATSKAVKTAYDKGVSALNKANEVDASTIKKTGSLQHVEGRLRINGVTGSWSGIEFGTEQGFWRFEGHPNSHNEQDRRANLFFKNNEGRSFYLSFPTIGNGQTVAYQSWVNNALSGKVNKAGDTMTGGLEIDAAHSFIRGRRSGVYQWYIGSPNATSDDVALHNYHYNHGIALKPERVESSKPFYVGNDRVPHAGDAYIDLTTSNYGGITIHRPERNDKLLFESNGEGFVFARRNRTTNQNHYVISMPARSGKVLLNNDIVILTGWVGNGSILPIPQGFSENECKFFISPRRTMELGRVNDRNNYHAPLDFYIEGTRRVVAKAYKKDGANTESGTGLKYDNSTVNYLVIGIKS